VRKVVKDGAMEQAEELSLSLFRRGDRRHGAHSSLRNTSPPARNRARGQVVHSRASGFANIPHSLVKRSFTAEAEPTTRPGGHRNPGSS
jgi:hypothetical protein